MEKDCNTCKFELYNAEVIPCKDCGMDDREYWKPKPQTNADHIRAMSDEELAVVVVCPHIGNWDLCRDDCKKCRLEWLKQPVERGGMSNGLEIRSN